jgi:hypothetical protein
MVSRPTNAALVHTPGGSPDAEGVALLVAVAVGEAVAVTVAVGVGDASTRAAGRHGSDTPPAATDAGTPV